MPILADCGYEGAGCGVLTPRYRTAPTASHCMSMPARTTSSYAACAACAASASAASLLTERWKALEHVTISPRRITQIARAALAITRFERGMTN